MTRIVTASLVGLCALAAPAATAQTGIDILQQTVTVDVVQSPLTIETTVLFEALSPTTEVYTFSTGAQAATWLVDGVPTTATDHPQYPGQVEVVDLPAPLSAGETATLTMQLTGPLDCGAGPNTVMCWTSAQETILINATVNAGWYLVNLFGADDFDATLSVHAPAAFHVAGPQGGPDTTTPQPDGTLVHQLSIAAADRLTLYAGQADLVEVDAPFAVTGAFHQAGDNAVYMEQAVTVASEAIGVYQDLFGPLPFDHAYLTTVPPNFAFGGLGDYGSVYIGEYIVGHPDYRYLLEQGMAHEFAHSWWGGMTSAADFAEGGALQEGLAEYSAWRALGALQGDKVRDAGMRMNAVWYLLGRPVGNDIAPFDPAVQDSPVYLHVAYHKAAAVYRAIEVEAGVDDFDLALAAVAAGGPGALSGQALVDELALLGHDVGPIVDGFLRQAGYATLAVETAYVDGTQTVTLTNLGGQTFTVPVRLTHDDGTSTEHLVAVGGAPVTVAIDVDRAPALVEVDPRWTAPRLLDRTGADVTFDGVVDAHDLLEVALRRGGQMPDARRMDGHYDPLYDLDDDGVIDEGDQALVSGG